jgi:hypothetical protein
MVRILYYYLVTTTTTTIKATHAAVLYSELGELYALQNENEKSLQAWSEAKTFKGFVCCHPIIHKHRHTSLINQQTTTTTDFCGKSCCQTEFRKTLTT